MKLTYQESLMLRQNRELKQTLNNSKQSRSTHSTTRNTFLRISLDWFWINSVKLKLQH